ncbi:unnamed protein product [Sphacelaria rigidula]
MATRARQALRQGGGHGMRLGDAVDSRPRRRRKYTGRTHLRACSHLLILTQPPLIRGNHQTSGGITSLTQKKVLGMIMGSSMWWVAVLFRTPPAALVAGGGWEPLRAQMLLHRGEGTLL